jgi:hypothetical protein
VYRRIFTLLTLLALPALTWADIGQIKNLSGDVQIQRGDQTQGAALGDRLEQSDVVQTGADGRVGITFVDNSRFSLGPDSRIELERFDFDATTHKGEFRSRLKKGTLAVISGQIAKGSPEAMKVATPSSVLAVRGTRFLVRVGQ